VMVAAVMASACALGLAERSPVVETIGTAA
jgi:hypothetical protein